MTIWASDEDVIDPMTNLPTHHLQTYHAESQAKFINMASFNAMLSAEIGVQLDSRLWRKTKQRVLFVLGTREYSSGKVADAINHLTEARRLANLDPTIRLSFQNPSSEKTSVFGKGITDLSRGVRSKGSLNAAAKDIGMAYSKAWRIIRDTEEALGLQLLERDGAHGSTLTKQADALLDTYFTLSERLEAEAQQAYRQQL